MSGPKTAQSSTHTRDLLEDLAATIAPLEEAARRAQWEAMTRGGDARYTEYQDRMVAYRAALSDPVRLDAIRSSLDEDLPPDLRRRTRVWELLLAAQQAAPEEVKARVALETRVEQAFSSHRAEVGGQTRTMNDLAALLRTETDRDLRRATWEAQKSVGDAVAEPMRQLMRVRNRLAETAGYRDWWDMQIQLAELDPDWLLHVFDELARITEAPFQAAKGRIDAALADHFGLAITELAPWDYADPFFQEVPAQTLPPLPSSATEDPIAGARRCLEELGFSPEPVLARSSLFEAPGKTPHAFTSDLDRGGDIRILANVRPTIEWHVTLLHELGHATYTQGIHRDLPWELRRDAHSLVTEGIALLFESLALEPSYLEHYAGLSHGAARVHATARREARRLHLLVFSRWCQVMVRFEAAAYHDPEQDLDGLWWDLVERYQGLRRPAGRRRPDWASKIHMAIAPVYYQNYLLGQAFAAQLRASLEQDGLSWHQSPDLDRLLRERLFVHGAQRPWPEAVELAVGRPLGVDCLLSEMVAD